MFYNRLINAVVHLYDTFNTFSTHIFWVSFVKTCCLRTVLWGLYMFRIFTYTRQLSLSLLTSSIQLPTFLTPTLPPSSPLTVAEGAMTTRNRKDSDSVSVTGGKRNLETTWLQSQTQRKWINVTNATCYFWKAGQFMCKHPAEHLKQEQLPCVHIKSYFFVLNYSRTRGLCLLLFCFLINWIHLILTPTDWRWKNPVVQGKKYQKCVRSLSLFFSLAVSHTRAHTHTERKREREWER